MLTLSIIVPTFNERATIVDALNAIEQQPLNGWNKQIIVVDDGSTDGTAGSVARIYPTMTIVRQDKNLGKGAAIRSALTYVRGDAVIIQDADLEYSPTDWPTLLQEFDNPSIKAVYGSRNLNPERRGYAPYVVGAWMLTILFNILYRTHLTDIYTGAKLFRDNAILLLSSTQSNGFEWEVEITAKITRNNIQIIEVPASYAPRSFTEGKKIRAQDGLKGLLAIFKYRF